MKRDIYLDNAATTRVRPEVVAAMVDMLEQNYGNPSSPHAKGLEAEAALRRAREQVARAIRVNPSDVVFTSGGTEANNLAIQGTVRSFGRRGGNIVCTATEHPSVLEAMRRLQREGFELRIAPVESTGKLDLAVLESLITEDTRLVSVAYVNNEIGTVQPIRQIGGMLRRLNPQALLHVDAVQALGKLPVYPVQEGIDLMSTSAHKIHGPKGVGALYIRKGVRLQAVLEGGQQERTLRSGTENMPGIVGMGEAIELAIDEMPGAKVRMTQLRKLLLDELESKIAGAQTVGPTVQDAAPHILNVSLPSVKGEVLVRMLGEDDLFISTGSACSTKSQAASHVLKAIGLSGERLDGAIRISLSYQTTEADVHEAVQRIDAAHNELRSWHR